jgi:hypothetical protein
MIRSIAIAAAFALSVTACASETEETEPTQEQSEKPSVDTELSPSAIGYCLPQKLPICYTGSMSCYCSSSGVRVCYCNP